MVRPKKFRFIGKQPVSDYFKPRGIPFNLLKEVILTIEEYEALRLKDIEEYEQTKAAELMNVSQPTFHRILDSARKKVSDAIINGKALMIQGGVFKKVERIYQCNTCRTEWIPDDASGECPECKSPDITKINEMGHRKRHGRNRGLRR